MSTDSAHLLHKRREGIVLLCIAAFTAFLFAVTPLDLAAARTFYRPSLSDPWPMAHRLPWSALYGAAPWITASLVLTGLAALVVGVLQGRAILRRNGVFLLLTVVIGPGLIVNLFFKDHWGRPRPRDIVEFAGTATYVSPLVPSRQGGASFPCGHCAVGFLYASGWWVWRREHLAWARTSLGVGIAAGFALGLGRMAAGGHFLSDVVWSALLALGVAHVLHDYALRVPEGEVCGPTAVRRNPSQIALAVVAGLGGISVLIALFGTPHGTSLVARIPLAVPPRTPWAFEFTARMANVDVVLIDAAPEIAVEGELHGFGLMASTLATKVDAIDSEVPTVRYQILQKGWFTDLDGSARIRIPVEGLDRVTVRVEHGDIRVIDRTAPAGGAKLTLDLHTGYGRILRKPHPAVKTSQSETP